MSEINETEAHRGDDYHSKYIEPDQKKDDGTVDSSFIDDSSDILSVIGKAALVFPKAEPLPWYTFFAISAMCAVPTFSYDLAFTEMGFGLEVYRFVAGHMEPHAFTLASALAAFIICLYMLDFSYWESKLGKIARHVSWGIFVSGCMVVVLFLSAEHPYLPICLFTVLTPIWLVLMHNIFYSDKSTKFYVSWLGGPLFFMSLVNFLIWLIWTFWEDEHEWNKVTQLAIAEDLGCEPDFETYPECETPGGDACYELMLSPPTLVFPEGCSEKCTRVHNGCLNPFILWVGPLLLSVTLLFLSFFCTFLRSEGTDDRDIINFGRLWIFLLFCMWILATFAGVLSGATGVLLSLTLASFVGSVVFVAGSFSRPDQKRHAKAIWGRVVAKYGEYLDPARGLAIAVTLPVALVYVGLSFMNQCVRRTGIFSCSAPARSCATEDKENNAMNDTEDDNPSNLDLPKTDWITERTRGQVNVFKSWDRSKVYTFAIYWGAAFMVLFVVFGKVTVLFLSWLIEAVQNFSLEVVTGILVGVGLVMFLLPPVPGGPIYMTLGIVIVPVGKPILGLAGSLIYANVVSLIIKLLACTMQQKVIGENLSQSVSIRQQVGINSELIKSARLVLAEPGLSIGKVSILVGGPDWPVSVLCGIMKLKLFPILLGTVPVIFLIIPMTLMGSFMCMTDAVEEDDDSKLLYPWAGVATAIFVALAAIVQLCSGLSASYFLQQTATLRRDEIAAIPNDKEVEEVEHEEKQRKEAYSTVTQWGAVPQLAKFTITLSLVCMVSSCYIVQLFPDSCFETYSLTNTISDDLDGNWANMFKPLGRVAILIFLLSCALLWCFTSWAKVRKSLSRLQVGG